MPETPGVSKSRTFADKFSGFKTRFMIGFWLIVTGLIFFYLFNFLSSLYAITRASESFYTISVVGNHAVYTRVSERPESWISLDKISKRLQQAVISSEDGKFYEHPGYDLEQLQDAIRDSFVYKKKMRGASTITQQLIKNLYLSREKTFGRKSKEMLMSLMIERYASKQKILEMYLNVIEYGKGLYGIGAASKYYFGKTPAQLNARESAFLAMLLPSPVKYAKSFKNKTLTSFASRTINSILLKMRQAGYIGENEYLAQLDGHFSWEIIPEEVKDPGIVEESEEDLSIGADSEN